MINGNNVLLIWPERDKGFYNFNPIGIITGQKTLFFPLPLIYVAAALGEEWNYSLVDEGVEPISDDQTDAADFYLISANLLQRYATERLIERLLPLKKPIVIGGPIIRTLDHVFRQSGISKVFGEIEAVEKSHSATGITVAEALSRDMRLGTLQSEYHAFGHPDITKIPSPRYDLVKNSDYFAFSMQTSRGCPHHCDFCQQAAFYGRHRRKSNTQIIADLDALLQLGENVSIILTDDNLMGDINNPEKKQEFIGVLETFRTWQEKNNFPFDFFTQCSLEVAEHVDIVERMSKIGLNMMFIGIETVDEAALAAVHKHQNLEMNMLEHIRTLQRYGMGVFAGVIIGFDTDTEESVDKQIEFIRKSNIPFVAPMMMLGLTGTKLHKRLQLENRISADLDALTKTHRTNIIPLVHPATQYGFLSRYIEEIYEPKEYFRRCVAWIKTWNDAYVIPGKKGSIPSNVRIKRILRSVFHQGILSDYRFVYLKYLVTAIVCFGRNYNKMSLALYLGYMFQIAYHSRKETMRFIDNLPQEIIDEWQNHFPDAG